MPLFPKDLELRLVPLDDPIWILHSDYKNAYCQDDEGKLLGINLSSRELQNEELERILANDLSELCAINLRGNLSLSKCVFPGAAPKLEQIDASECALTEFRLPETCKALRILTLGKNELPRIEFLGKYPELQHIDLSNNQLKSLKLAKGFNQVKYLYLNDNNLKHLDIASFLPELRTLHLRNNELEALPATFLSYHKLEALYLYNNPLPEIPKEVISSEESGNSLEGVRNYLSSLEDHTSTSLFEAKMILVGNGEVGKTSIRIRLLDKEAPLPTKEERTEGLDIESYTLEGVRPTSTKLSEEIDFQFNIWDFGGQGKYREVQQLFCSRKSLYIFVTAYDDDPEDQNYVGFEYWLDMVNAYSYDDSQNHLSPVIHVVNKIDMEEKRVNEKDRTDLFPNIIDFVKISCVEVETFKSLESSIRKALPKLSSDIFTTKYADPWIEVKDVLIAQQKDNHISYDDYEALCLEHKLSKSEAKTWLETLDRIGTVIYFGDHEELKNWVILNPNWIKNIMYQVINSPSAKKGKIRQEDLPLIWPKYQEEDHQKFLELMKAYHFCYSQPEIHGGIEYIVPACLPVEKPDFPKHLKIPSYQFKCSYDPFIPAGTVNKFIVFLQGAEKTEAMRGFVREKEAEIKQMDVNVYGSYMWRNNVIIEAPEERAYAHIEEVWQDKAVYINLYGEEVKSLYEFIIQGLGAINERTKQAKYLNRLSFTVEAWYKKHWEGIEKLTEVYEVDIFKSEDKSSMNSKEYVIELITQNRLKEALDTIIARTESENIQSQAILLLQRLNSVESQILRGMMNFDSQQVEKSKITNSIITLNNAKELEGPLTPLQTPNEKTPSQSEMLRKRTGKRKILYLAANPGGQTRLRLDQEYQKLKSELLQGVGRDAFEFLSPEFGVTTSVLLRAVNQKPHIVHFSGHGLEKGIVISNENDQSQLISTKAIRRLFKPLAGLTEIVILNACYSKDQARVLSEFGMFVVGNNLPIKDTAAISFSKGLYNGLGEGKSFEAAFNDAMFMVVAEAPESEEIIEVWKDGVILDL